MGPSGLNYQNISGGNRNGTGYVQTQEFCDALLVRRNSFLFESDENGSSRGNSLVRVKS